MNIVNKSLVAFIVVSYTFYKGLHQVFVYQVDVDVIISRHTQKSEMKDTYRIYVNIADD